MEETIHKSITSRECLEFEYADHRRVLQPFILYRSSDGKTTVEGYQVGGTSESDTKPCWRSFHVEKINELKRTDCPDWLDGSEKITATPEKKDNSHHEGYADIICAREPYLPATAIPNDPSGEHADNYSKELDIEDDPTDVTLVFDSRQVSDGYGPIRERGLEIELEHPVSDAEILELTKHIQAQFHAERKDQWEDHEVPNDGTVLYDRAILTVAERALEAEEIHQSELDCPERRVKAILLKEARNASSFTKFREYLLSSPETCKLLGYADSDIPVPETFRKEIKEEEQSDAVNRLSDELAGGVEQIRSAAIRAKYAAFRNGVVPPENVVTEDNLEAVSPPLDEIEVDPRVKREALRIWVRLLLNETTAPLTLYRENPTFDMTQYIGVFAASALYKCGLDTVPDVLGWQYDRSKLPEAFSTSLAEQLKDIPIRDTSASNKQGINAQFDAVHKNTFALAEEFNFFDQNNSVKVAPDVFRIEWTGKSTVPSIDRPGKFENDVRSEWTYVTLAIVDTEERFTLGSRWTKTKKHFDEYSYRLFNNAEDQFTLDTIFADTELSSGSLITLFRDFAEDWVVSAPNNPEVEILKGLTPSNLIGVIDGYPRNCTPKPNVVAYPKEGDQPDVVEVPLRLIREVKEKLEDDMDIEDLIAQQKTLSSNWEEETSPDSIHSMIDELGLDSRDGVGNKTSHRTFLTDRNPKERSGTRGKIEYHQRWAVEESINQITNDFLPVTQGKNEKKRLYGVNMGIVFQNWHTFINRARSPMLHLRLDVTHQEVLTAIVDVAFDSRDQIQL